MKKRILDLQPYKPGKSPEDIKREYNIDKVIKLASNENPYGCSPHVETAVLSSLHDTATYPDGYATELRKKVSDHLNVNENQLLFGSGLDEVIQMISRVLLCEGDNIITANETFPQYKHHAIIEGAEVREIPLDNGSFDLDGMFQAIDDRTKIVWICNPNNPSGTYLNKETLVRFLEKVPPEIVVVLDEAYYEYVTADNYPNSIPLLTHFNHLIVLRTFSKAYGLAAFRIGYAVGNAQLIEKINIARLPFNTSTFAQQAALAALEDQDFVKKCVRKNTECLRDFEQTLQRLNVEYYPSQANFIFVRMASPMELFNFFLKKGYIVRPFPNGVRITIGTKEQNKEVLAALEDYVKGHVFN